MKRPGADANRTPPLAAASARLRWAPGRPRLAPDAESAEPLQGRALNPSGRIGNAQPVPVLHRLQIVRAADEEPLSPAEECIAQALADLLVADLERNPPAAP